MPTAKENPKRWYIVMVMCAVLGFFSFAAGPSIGYNPEAAHTIGIIITLWAPILGIMGLRAELLSRKE